MEKIEFPEKDSGPEPSKFGSAVKEKISGFKHWLFGVTKFLLGVLLLPFVYSVTASFLNQLSLTPKPQQDYFWAGVASFLVIYLLIWEPAKIYAYGHKILEMVFNYFKPLVKVAPYLLPIYTITFAVAYLFLSLAIKSTDLLNYTLFLFGFSLSLHLVFSAKSLRAKKADFLKGNYIFGFSFVHIINIGLLSLFLNLIFEPFSFVNFSNQAFQIAKNIFSLVFKQLFL